MEKKENSICFVYSGTDRKKEKNIKMAFKQIYNVKLNF